jgi:MFS family permease
MRERFALAPLVELLSRPSVLLPLFVAMVGTYVVQGVMSFLPTFLVEFRGYSPSVAAGVFSAFFVVRAVAQVGLGRLSDRAGRDTAIGAAMLMGAVGTASFVFGPDALGVGVAVLLAGTGASFFSAIDPRFMDALSDAERGAGFGLVRTVYTVVGSAGSFGVGLAADLFGWGVSFGILAVLFGVTFAALAANWALGTGY